jgi:diguanylate cyclase (GGDEF)-like protein/PAS domain S-box-containing protein
MYIDIWTLIAFLISASVLVGLLIWMHKRDLTGKNERLEMLSQVYATTTEAVSITRLADGVFVDVNNVLLVLTGYAREELLGNSTITVNLWANVKDRSAFVGALLEKGECINKEFEFRCKDGSLILGLISGRIVPIRGTPHIVSMIRDITERKQAQIALQESEELYRSILNAFPDDITITDLQGKLLVTSPAAHLVFGYEPNYDYSQMTIADFIVPADLARARENIRRMHDGTYVGPNDYHGLRHDRTIIDIEVNSGLIHDADGKPRRMVFIVRDISERKLAAKKIQDLVRQLEIEKLHAESIAMTDGLTGLANRRYFDEALQREFYRMKRSGAPFSLILLDIDNFKKYNDSYGHVLGDECLRRVATTLQMVVGRVPDILARYGGEEFVIILPATDAQGAVTLAERIRSSIEDLAIPHRLSDPQWVTISLGVISATATIELNEPKDVVTLADRGLYLAKSSGRNCVRLGNGRASA